MREGKWGAEMKIEQDGIIFEERHKKQTAKEKLSDSIVAFINDKLGRYPLEDEIENIMSELSHGRQTKLTDYARKIDYFIYPETLKNFKDDE